MLAAVGKRIHQCCRPFSTAPTAVRAHPPAAAAAAAGRRGTAAAAAGQAGSRGSHRAAQVAAAAAAAGGAAAGPPMEVEVKLRLPGPEAHAQLAALLQPGLVATHHQENYFFDGPGRELNSRRVVLRLRFYDTDRKAVLTLKGQQILADGIGRASEVEEPLEPRAARTLLEQPSRLLALPSELMQALARQYGLRELVCLGGFTNTRQEASWRRWTLELDDTAYPWGHAYELEAETDEPEELRGELEQLLQGAGIPYSYSTTSKFANFINKTLL